MLDSFSPQTTKNRIMDAAEDVVMRLGAAHLTFDILAKETSLSKGGILYHYPNKKTLLRDMVQRMIDRFAHDRQRHEAKMEQTGLVNAKTYILAAFDKDSRYQESSTALMAAAANDPELLELVREEYRGSFAEIRAAGKDAGLTALIYMAVDGVWLLDSLGLCLFTDDERDALKKLLLDLAEARKFKFSVTGGQS